MTTATATTWAGWYRQTKWCPWERVATAATEGECWAALLDALKALPSGMSVVVKGDAPPAERRAR
jgi:hypothetical protein